MESKKRFFSFSKKDVSLFFLGAGLTLFLLNISAAISILPYIEVLKGHTNYPLLGYYVSILSSIFLMTYASYILYIENDD